MKLVKSLAGRVLTVLDASFPEGSQRNALKSLVKREARTTLDRIYRIFAPPNCEVTQTQCGEEEMTQEL